MAKKKTRTRKLSLIFRLLFYWGKILGLNPLSLSKNDKLVFSYSSMVYDCLLISSHFYLFYCIVIERINMILPGDSSIGVIVDIIGVIFTFLELTLMWLTCGFCQNHVKIFIKSFSKAMKTSQKLGISDEYESYYKKLAIYLLSVNLIYFGLMIINYPENVFSGKQLLIWISYIAYQLASINMLTLFIWILIFVKRKFQRLNEKMYVLMRHNYENANEVDMVELSESIRNSR